MIVEKGGKFNQAWPRYGSGLSPTRTPDLQRVEVRHVSPDSPAERAGFQVGDIPKSVGGKSVDELDGILGVRELLRAAPGMEYQVVVERAGEERTLNLKLAELL
jgi:C-terminal processing protease CtpA/Prc